MQERDFKQPKDYKYKLSLGHSDSCNDGHISIKIMNFDKITEKQLIDAFYEQISPEQIETLCDTLLDYVKPSRRRVNRRG